MPEEPQSSGTRSVEGKGGKNFKMLIREAKLRSHRIFYIRFLRICSRVRCAYYSEHAREGFVKTAVVTKINRLP